MHPLIDENYYPQQDSLKLSSSDPLRFLVEHTKVLGERLTKTDRSAGHRYVLVTSSWIRMC
jgi:hypothetical protein